MSALEGLIHAGLGACRVGLEGREGLMAGLFLTGLAGSLSHCAGMCGPFVLAQVAGRMEAIPLERLTEWRRLAGAALLPYHLGRAITYAGLGAVAASFAGVLGGAVEFRRIGAVLLLAATLLLLAMALPGLKGIAGQEGSRWAETVGRLARPLFASPFGWRGLVLGLALGFIPCGLLYAALTAAAAGGNAIAGAFGMLAFAAGTMPLLVAVGALGHAAVNRWRGPLLRLAPLVMVLNAAILAMMAWQMLDM